MDAISVPRPPILVPTIKDRELSEKKSRAVSEAERTGSGDFEYCDRDEAEKRKSERQF